MPQKSCKKVEKEKQVKCYIVPRGFLPKRHTADAVGFDVGIRAICDLSFDCDMIGARKTVFGFREKDPKRTPKRVRDCIKMDYVNGNSSKEPVFMLRPGESVLVSFGVCLGLPEGWYAELVPRSSTAAAVILLLHQGVPIEPTFNGEFVCRVYNLGKKAFQLSHGRRIAQLKFFGPKGLVYPTIVRVKNHSELGTKGRGCHGSTGSHCSHC